MWLDMLNRAEELQMRISRIARDPIMLLRLILEKKFDQSYRKEILFHVQTHP